MVGLPRVKPPSNDQEVSAFISQKGVTFPIARTSNLPWAYFDVPGTPFIVLVKDRHVVWENSMQTPDVLLDQLLAGLEKGDRR